MLSFVRFPQKTVPVWDRSLGAECLAWQVAASESLEQVSFSKTQGRQNWGVHEHKRDDNSETFGISMTHGFGMDEYDDDGKFAF